MRIDIELYFPDGEDAGLVEVTVVGVERDCMADEVHRVLLEVVLLVQILEGLHHDVDPLPRLRVLLLDLHHELHEVSEASLLQ